MRRGRTTLLVSTVLLAVAAGTTGALGAAGFREGLFALERALHGNAGQLVAAAQALSWWERLLFPVAGGLVAGCILQFGLRWVREQHSADYLEAITLGRGGVGVGSTFVKGLSSLCSVATGASIGREGAMVQCAATAGALIGSPFRISAKHRQLLVACAAAAGLATAYNAPIAGALFVAEIALGTHALARLAPILLASMVGNAIAREVFGPAPLFSAGSLQAGGLMEMPAWLALGALAGAVAPLFLWLITTARKTFSRLTVPLAVRMALGGLVVGTISIAEPRVWGNGYSVIDALLHAKWAWIAVTQVLLLKAIATAATSGSGAVGGIFTPTLLIGAGLGNLFGAALTASIPGVAGTPAAYAAIGMGALLAATTHAPLTAILMIIETTGGDALTLPLTAACVVAYLVVRAVGGESVYADSLRAVPADGVKVTAKRDSG